MYFAALAVAAAAAAPQPVAVVSDEVALARHDRAPIQVRCNRTRHACEGVLVVGVPDCPNQPVRDPRCQAELGRKRFAIRPRRTRTVVVSRTVTRAHDVQHVDATVLATPYLHRPPYAQSGPRTRPVKLVAPPGVRPVAPTRLRLAMRLRYGDNALFFTAVVPLSAQSVDVALGGHGAELHPRGSAAYALGSTSFAVGGAIWHGETKVADGELAEGERHAYTLHVCDGGGCTDTPGAITLARDDRYDPRPICMLRPLTAVYRR